MKKFTQLRALLAMLLMFVGLSAWSQNVVYTLDTSNENNKGTNSAYASACDVTVGGITWNVTGNATMQPWRIGGKSLSNVDRVVKSKTATSEDVDVVRLTIGDATATINSIKLAYSTNSDFSGATTITANGTDANTSYDFAPEGGFKSGTYFQFIINVTVSTSSSNKYVHFSKVEFITNSDDTPADDPVAVESVSLTDDKGNAMGMYHGLVQGESIQLKAVVAPSNATNKKVTWDVLQDENVISLENGLVKALAPGRAAVTVTTEDGEKQAAVTFIVTEPQPSTIADFIANEGGTCYLTGIVSDIVMDKTDATKQNVYGNFNLTDKTGTIYVYGCLTPAGEAKKFDTLGVEEGNEITVLASVYELFNGTTKEAKNVVFVENHGTPAAPVECSFDVAFNANKITIIPSEDGVQYYFNIVPAEYYTVEELPYLFDNLLEEMGEGLDYYDTEETEPLSWWVDTDETNDYIVAVITVNDNYERTSDVTVIPFSAANMTVTSAGYATFVAPFQVAVPTGVKAYTVDAVEGEALTLTQVSTIAANTPVVLEGSLDATQLWGKTVEGTPKAGLLTGVYEETEAPVGSYVLQAQDAVGFYKVAEGQEPTVGVNRAYLTVASDVKAFSLSDATAIKSLEALTSGKAQIFDMNGRQINKLQKGINIVNGVKVLVK